MATISTGLCPGHFEEIIKNENLILIALTFTNAFTEAHENNVKSENVHNFEREDVLCYPCKK